MSSFSDVIFNRAITVPALAWFIAQTLKVVSVVLKERKLDFTRFVGSGGMPSSHSAFIMCLTAVIGKNNGWDSEFFALSFAISLIVMYDAAGIRRAAGKQAVVLNKLMDSLSHRLDIEQIEENLKELLGHTPFEVVMGALLGVIIGLWLG